MASTYHIHGFTKNLGWLMQCPGLTCLCAHYTKNIKNVHNKLFNTNNMSCLNNIRAYTKTLSGLLSHPHWLFNRNLEVSWSCIGATVATPPTAPQSYDFRKWPQSRQISNCCPYLTECNFVTRMLFSDIYWLMFMFSSSLITYWASPKRNIAFNYVKS